VCYRKELDLVAVWSGLESKNQWRRPLNLTDGPEFGVEGQDIGDSVKRPTGSSEVLPGRRTPRAGPDANNADPARVSLAMLDWLCTVCLDGIFLQFIEILKASVSISVPSGM
jgi:hypothetical protein